MTSAVTVSLGAAATARRLFEPIYRLYYETFSKPPYQWPEGEEEQYRRRFERLMGDPTFGIAVAQCGDELAGFAYGYTLRPDTKWWEGFVTPVPPEVTTEWEGRTFALIDFAVDESVRGKGVGRRLHDTLLGSRHEERATLAVEPQAHEARGIYEHWGWQVVGRLRGPATDFAPEFDIMVLPLSLKAQAVSLGGRCGAVHAVAAPLLSAARVTTAQLPTGAVHAIGLSDSGLREPPPHQ
ncbi:GNAT family N-acetyltransferase [Carbonactinospora thermoautotrophica]|uniref:GNAT family N-acetyltransferase n=1 Tax=Carbonactinospora thermoautotrophica TaxID=1469144 RepID=UPI003DAA40AF